MHLSWGFPPLQRVAGPGRPYHPGEQPLPALSVRRVSHPLDGLLHPDPGGPSFRSVSSVALRRERNGTARLALVGFPRTSIARPRPFDLAGRVAPAFPLQGLLLVRDGHVFACPPLSRFIGSLASLGRHRPNDERSRQAPQSLDRRRIGVSHGSYPRAPAFLRFLADSHAHGRGDSRSLGYPSVARRRLHRSNGPYGTASLLPTSCPASPMSVHPASDPTTNRVVESRISSRRATRSRSRPVHSHPQRKRCADARVERNSQTLPNPSTEMSTTRVFTFATERRDCGSCESASRIATGT